MPTWQEGRGLGLTFESTVQNLIWCHFSVDVQVPGAAVAQIFEREPTLPGVIITDQEQFLGMISRQRLLEYLLRPQGMELFLQQPIQVLYSYARVTPLLIAETTKITSAARRALRRPPEFQTEPIVIQAAGDEYYLLSSTELNTAYWQVRGLETQVHYERAQAQMIQSEKMASLGRLVDGVAHEILDPVGFIWGNLTHVSTYSQQLLTLLEAYQACCPHPPDRVLDLEEDMELDYVKADLPKAIASIRGGATRLKTLASSLQTFCHIDEVYPKPADLHDCIDSILILLKERLSGEIRIVRNYAPLPPVNCFIGQLSQVFMNILMNSVEAILEPAVICCLDEEFGDNRHCKTLEPENSNPQIQITTQIRSRSAAHFAAGLKNANSTGERPPATDHAPRWVVIQIADNGPGLSESQHRALLETFSTQKRMAKETSLGLSYHIVTAKHGGSLNVRSPRSCVTEGELPGTEFEIWLPLTD